MPSREVSANFVEDVYGLGRFLLFGDMPFRVWKGEAAGGDQGGSQKPGWMLWLQPGPPWRPGSWWGAAQILLQTQEVGPPFLLQSCPPKSLPFILTEPPSGPRPGNLCQGGCESWVCVPLAS